MCRFQGHSREGMEVAACQGAMIHRSAAPLLLCTLLTASAHARADMAESPVTGAMPAQPAQAAREPSPPAAPGGEEGRGFPDEGPRAEPWVSEEQLHALQPGREAFAAEQWDAALWMFARVEEQAGEPGLAAIARALRAETVYRRQATSQFRLDAIDVYQGLIRDFPQSANASRAGWRVGDLFAEQGWQVEAQAAYERAARDAVLPHDTTRAFLGLGLMYVETERWKDAVQTLKGLRNNELDEVSRGWVTFGLAEGLYALGRRSEAGGYFRTLAERWPDRLRFSPSALLHAADIEQASGRPEPARRLRLLFYNLYPTHPDAPGTLVTLGDNLQVAGRPREAELFYGLAVQWHARTEAAEVAKLRLARLGQELTKQPGRPPFAIEIGSVLYGAHHAPLSLEAQRQVFQSVSESHQDRALASEALFLLAEHHLRNEQPAEAQAVLQRVCEREGLVAGDIWPGRARQQLAQLLRPEMAASIRMADDFQTVQLFHRYGSCPDWKSGHVDLLLHVAEAHRRLGFLEPAVHLYQQVLRDLQGAAFRDHALIGLGRTYLDQRDGAAARRVFERYQLEYPLGALKADALRSLSESWALMGDAGAVIKACQRWFKLLGERAVQDPGYGQMLLRLAGAQAIAGRHREAIKTVRLAERAGVLPYAEARFREGRYLDAAGSSRAAIAQWAEVVRVDPQSSEAALARLNMARVWWQQRRLNEVGAVLSHVSSGGDEDVFSRAAAVLKSAVAVQAQLGKERKP